jgi:cbb3-type cytochrome oxidase subunit 1
MSFRIDVAFLRIALLYIVAGMIMGIYMAASGDHSLMPAHTHIQLLGGATMMLFALIYRAWPEMAKSPLAKWHFWLANIGALILNVAVTGIHAGYPETFEIYAKIGSIVTLAGMISFVTLAFKATCEKS